MHCHNKNYDHWYFVLRSSIMCVVGRKKQNKMKQIKMKNVTLVLSHVNPTFIPTGPYTFKHTHYTLQKVGEEGTNSRIQFVLICLKLVHKILDLGPLFKVAFNYIIKQKLSSMVS